MMARDLSRKGTLTIRVGNYFYVSGTRAIVKELETLSIAMAQTIIWKALAAASVVVILNAKRRSPPKDRTGTLRNAYSKRKWSKGGEFLYAMGAEAGVRRFARLVTVGKSLRPATRRDRSGDAYYFRWLEEGWRAVGTRRRTQRKTSRSTSDDSPGASFYRYESLEPAHASTAAKQLKVINAKMRVELQKIRLGVKPSGRDQGTIRTREDPRLFGQDRFRVAREIAELAGAAETRGPLTVRNLRL